MLAKAMVQKITSRIGKYLAGRSIFGLILGTFFFCASLTPSLTPRPPLMLGVVAGASFAMGYLFALILRKIWIWLGLKLPMISARTLRLVSGAALILAVGFLWFSIEWQNDVRAHIAMAPHSRWELIKTAIVALGTFLLLYLVGRAIWWLFGRVTRRLDRFLPRRVSILLGGGLALILSWMVVNGVIFRTGLHLMDASYRELDARIESNIAAPTQPNSTGGPGSLINWGGLGRQGRIYIASAPSQADIAALTGAPAAQPIRVYAGLNSADSPDERARLALAELKRVGGFERPVLVVIAPTGTGWVDAAAIDTLEYLHHGQIASVAMQYSYLSSWLSLLVEPEYGVESARALFRHVYAHWKTLPAETRPKLYLHGLSLGALGSQASLNLFDVLDDPINGALWSGPPFPSTLWKQTTRERMPDSPVWLPRFRNSSTVRFTNQGDHLSIPGAEWGQMRIVYLQYGSDAITFFEPSAFFQQPEWMIGTRAPDVSPGFRWVPGVTFLQLLVDMVTGMNTPPGFGHVFAAADYMDGWVAVTDPEGWNDARLAELRTALAQKYDQPG